MAQHDIRPPLTGGGPTFGGFDSGVSATPPSRLALTQVTPAVLTVDPNELGHPTKRVIGDVVEFAAIVVCDGAAEIRSQVRITDPQGNERIVPMTRGAGYTFTAEAEMTELGRHAYVVEAWVDQEATLQSRITRKRAAGQDTSNEEQEIVLLGDQTRTDLIVSNAEEIVVDRRLASFAAWYELFPRSTASEPGGHGTFRTCQDRLDYVASLGYDILYLPPIHPIGRSHRKGVNNAVEAAPGDVGSPWAIGASEGGHTAVHPDLGTLDDFDQLVAAANARGIEIAMDIAFQCSPDHPWVREHPEWFSVRPDGSIAYAENPPKRYQDIVPFNFDSEQWRDLWRALADVVRFWRRRGVRIFRVDNPHTKPFRFWEWLISELKADDPGIIFLAEAFAHPEVMMQLSRVGFSVSYTHFPWQHAPHEIRDYFHLLAEGDRIDYFRGSAWVNTPDILTDELQQGLPQVFQTRLILASTLSANYGVYGPVYELEVSAGRGEEYDHGEKYEVRHWELDRTSRMCRLMARLNEIRRSHAALQHDRSLVFHHCDDPRLVAYTKTPPRRVGDAGLSQETILVIANTDHYNVHDGIVRLDLGAAGFADPSPDVTYEVHDLLSDQRFEWRGSDNYVRLDPWYQPAHVFAIRRTDFADQQRELT